MDTLKEGFRVINNESSIAAYNAWLCVMLPVKSLNRLKALIEGPKTTDEYTIMVAFKRPGVISHYYPKLTKLVGNA